MRTALNTIRTAKIRLPAVRPTLLWLHRWGGLAMAAFLMLEGLTGALLSFNDTLRCALLPSHFTAHAPTPDARRLSPAQLFDAARAAVAPHGAVHYQVGNREGQVIYKIGPHTDPVSGKAEVFPYSQIFIDPWTGAELGRLDEHGYTDGIAGNIMPVVYQLHLDMMLGKWGGWIIGLAALAWTIDCLVGLYLTLPQHAGAFWRRWKPAWQVQWGRGAYRLNFDLHRAGGLWPWLLLLVLAWSSVELNDPLNVYAPVMKFVTGDAPFESEQWMQTFFPHQSDGDRPALDATQAEAVSRRYLQDMGAREGFAVEEGVSLNHFAYATRYNYTARTNRSFPQDHEQVVFIDSNTGALVGTFNTNDGGLGPTAGNWLRALHMARDPLGYTWYRVILCLGGIVLVTLSATGIYVWWKKRQARQRRLIAKKS